MARYAEMSRRTLVAGIAVSAATVLPGPIAASGLVPTPRQTAGPFYPDTLPLDHDADLVRVDGRGRQAEGEVLHLSGRLMDARGRPVSNARVEIWQCDAFGSYHHPRDGGGADPNFQGYGRATTAADGGYRFRTIKPVPYPGRTPHIHFRISGPGFEALTTQMYLAGHPLNARDWIFNRVSDARARDSLLVALARTGEPGSPALAGRFDIVLGRTVTGG